MKKNLNRALSMLLSILMVFSLFPLNIFAATKTNTGAGNGKNGSQFSENNGILTAPTQNYIGMRFSLYFYEPVNGEKWESSEQFEEAFKAGNFTANQLGDVVDMVQSNPDKIKIAYSTGLTVFDWMSKTIPKEFRLENKRHIGEGDIWFSLDKQYNDRVKKESNFNFNGSFPKIVKEGTNDPKRYEKFFVGTNVTEDNFAEYIANGKIADEFKNLMAVINVILEGSGTVVSAEDFALGLLQDEFGNKIQGVYKFYMEPLVAVQIYNNNYVATAKDLVSLNNFYESSNGKSVINHACSAFANAGNGAWIVEPEYQIEMGTDGGYHGKGWTNNTSTHAGQSYPTSDWLIPSSEFWLNGGLSVITGWPYDNKVQTALPVHIVTYYVTIGEDGKYKMLQDPEVRQVDESSDLVKVTYTGTDGNNLVMQTNMLYVEPEDVVKKGNYEGDKCYLNDVITSAEHYDKATLESGVDWLYTTPSVNGNFLQRPMVVKDKLEILVENPEDVDISQLDALKEQKMSNTGSVDGVVTSDYVNVAKGGVGAGNALTVGNHGDKKNISAVNIPGLYSEYRTWLMGS